MESELVLDESGNYFFNLTDSYFLSDDDSTIGGFFEKLLELFQTQNFCITFSRLSFFTFHQLFTILQLKNIYWMFSDDIKIDLQHESLEELIDYFNFVHFEDDEEPAEDDKSASKQSEPIFINTQSASKKLRRRAGTFCLKIDKVNSNFRSSSADTESER